MRLLCLVVATALSVSAQEVARNSRVRFPSEMNPQMDLGPQLFESESQALPVIIHGNGGIINTPHIIMSKAPSTINPFGQIAHNGYAEGLILPYYQPPERLETEFHQTMPPPLRATPYGPPKAITNNNQGNRQPTLQKPHRNQERQPERHRFGPHRVPFIQQSHKPQNQFTTKQHRPSGHHLKENKHQQPESLFKYSIVTNHNQPKIPHTEKYEQDFYKPHKQPVFIKHKRPMNHPIQQHQYSDDMADFPDDSSEFDQGIPDWQIKGNFQDTPVEHDSYFFKKNKNKQPHVGSTVTGNKNPFNGDFSFNDDFSSFPSFQNKRYPQLKQNSEYKRGEVKAVYEPMQEQPLNTDYKYKKFVPKVQNLHEDTKSLESSSQENHSGESFYSDYDFPEHFHSRQEAEPSSSNFGSEWIPINAPEGVVPAKSYDIPPPDLSRGQGYRDRNIVRREYSQDREDSNLVYGVRKPNNNEEVVSAVVRVKQ